MQDATSTKSAAYHEAGHAVAAVVLRIGLNSVDIKPLKLPDGQDAMAGTDMCRPQDHQILGKGEDAVMPFLMTLIAGYVAERMVNPHVNIEVGHPNADGELVQRYATAAVCTPVSDQGNIVFRAEEAVQQSDRIGRLLDKAESMTEEFVKHYRAAISTVASELQVHQHLSAEEVQAIVDTHST